MRKRLGRIGSSGTLLTKSRRRPGSSSFARHRHTSKWRNAMKTVMLVIMLMTTALMPHSPPPSTSPPVPTAERPLDAFVSAIDIHEGGVRFDIVLVNNLSEPIRVSRWSLEGLLAHRCVSLSDPDRKPVAQKPGGNLFIRGSLARDMPSDAIVIPATSAVSHCVSFTELAVPDHLQEILANDSSVVIEGDVSQEMRDDHDKGYSVRSVSRPFIRKS